MSTEELKEYLGIVVDMEKSIFLQNNLCANITGQIESLKKAKVFVDPSEPVEPQPDITTHTHGFELIFIIAVYFGIAFGCAIIPVGIALDILFHIKSTLEGWCHVLSVSLVLAVAYVAYQLYKMLSEENHKNKGIQEKNAQKEREYQNQIESYKKALVVNQTKRQQDEANRRAKIIFLQNQKVEIGKRLTIAKEHLQKIYDKNIIFPKYRNLTMVCSLYEYICAGRCTELEGHEGAYNIIETEIRLDHIILQLDKVIAQLEQIKNNQFMLYSAVQESNHRSSLIQRDLDRMAGSLDGLYTTTAQLNANAAQLNARITELQETSALTAYHTERTQKELAYMNRMDYLSGRNDNVFWNHPPV